MLFDIKLTKTELFQDGVYLEFRPINEELAPLLYNGNTYQLVNSSITETISANKNTVRDELYNNLPEDVKSLYTNARFVINDSIDDPRMIDYDIIGLNKKRIIIKGELRVVEYYKNYDTSANTYSDLVVLETRDYIRDEIGIAKSRNQTSSWILTDGTTGLTINFTKYYTPEEGIQEGLDRRTNMINFAKTALLDGLKVIHGEPANQNYTFDMLTSVKTQIDYFIQGYTQPLRDAVSASTKPYLTVGIKEAVIEQLTF